MLPEPNISFTLPSIHDHHGTPLDCRVYHPESLNPDPRSPPWNRHAAVVAHPYGPLGGSRDDPIVDAVAGILLRLGFLVATFNFRGAGGSAGRTSWTATAERADYMSVVGFMAYYTHFLDPFSRSPSREQQQQPLSPVATSTVEKPTTPTFLSPPTTPPPPPSPRDLGPPVTTTPILLMGGYSYGSMITAQLPPLETILARFDSPGYGSPTAEIRLRAEHLAQTQNTVLGAARAAAVERLAAGAKAARRSLPPLRVGGDEDKRASHDTRRSLTLEFHHYHQQTEERIRKGVADLIAKTRRCAHASSPRALHADPSGTGTGKEKDGGAGDGGGPSSPQTMTSTEAQNECLAPVPDRVQHQPVYLLVSPLQGVINSLATMSFMPRFTLSSSPSKASPKSSSSTSPPPKSGHCKAASESGQAAKRKPTLKLRQSGISKTPASPSPDSALLLPDAEQKLVDNPTMAIYGDRDVFVTARRLRDWTTKLQRAPGSRFRAHEVSSAGHFWVEDRALDILESAVHTFGASVLRPDEQNKSAGAVPGSVAGDVGHGHDDDDDGTGAIDGGATGTREEGVATAVASAG